MISRKRLMNFLSNNQKGSFYAIISGLCYGFMGYFGIKVIEAGSSVYNMLFWRFFISTLIMFFIFIPKRKIILGQYKNCVKIILYGIGFYGASSITYFLASVRIGSGISMVIFFIYPSIVMAMNVVLYKAKINKSYYIAFSFIIIGLLFMVHDKEFIFDLLGVMFCILSALFYAFYMVVSKEMDISPLLSTLMLSIGCSITCFIASYYDSSLQIPSGIDLWINLFGIALISTAIPMLLLLEGLKYISSEKASMLSVFEPVFVFILGVWLLGEQINIFQIIGTIILLSGTLITLIPGKNDKPISG